MDAALIRWFMLLRETGDLEKLVLPEVRAPSKFLGLFERCDLYFCVDDEAQIQGAFWVEPFLSSAFLSVWLRQDFRQAAGIAWIRQGYAMVLERWPIIFGFTGQERLLPVHRKMGYTVLECIPGAWDGGPGWVLSLKREDWLARHRTPELWWSK